MICRLLGHKHERKNNGWRESTTQHLTEKRDGRTITMKVRWCFRCEAYIFPPLSERFMDFFFGEDRDEQALDSR